MFKKTIRTVYGDFRRLLKSKHSKNIADKCSQYFLLWNAEQVSDNCLITVNLFNDNMWKPEDELQCQSDLCFESRTVFFVSVSHNNQRLIWGMCYEFLLWGVSDEVTRKEMKTKGRKAILCNKFFLQIEDIWTVIKPEIFHMSKRLFWPWTGAHCLIWAQIKRPFQCRWKNF